MTAGDTRACSPPGVATCAKGTQTCAGATALTWGSCTGWTACPPDASPPPPDAPPAPPPMGCLCNPSKKRICDTPTGCLYGTQTCLPGGTWGTCVDGAVVPGCSGTFSLDCCLKAGQCCQITFDLGVSVGNCKGIMCVDDHAPDGTCSTGGECLPAATRDCIVAIDSGASWDSVWGKQTCGADGTWPRSKGSCVPSGDKFCKVDPLGYAALECCVKAGRCCAVDRGWDARAAYKSGSNAGPLVQYSAGDCGKAACK